jgi:hypothetical protein
MTYPVAFWLEILTAFAVGTGAIAYLRKRKKRAVEEQRANSRVPVGHELAAAVATYLKGGLNLCFRHRDGCGMGLRCVDGKFVYGSVSDGDLPSEEELKKWGWNDPERLEFDSDEEFVSWLEAQTDLLLANDENSQRLTRQRLIRAVQFCMTHDRKLWPSYAG